MKKTFLAILVLFAPLFVLAQYDPQALATLDAMSKKYKAYNTFEADLTTSLTNESDGVKEEYKGKITVKGDKFRLVLEDQEVINNGTTVWNYLPAANEVNIDNFDKNSDEINPSKIYEIYKKGFKYLFIE